MNKVVHFEIPVDDLDRAKKFYNIFDWQMTDGSVYVGIRTAEVDKTTYTPKEPGAINGGMILRDKFTKTPLVAINVPSVDEYIEKVLAAGGAVVRPKQNIENMGFYAYVEDTEGNLLGLWEDIIK